MEKEVKLKRKYDSKQTQLRGGGVYGFFALG